MRPTPAEAGRTRPGLTARDVTALSLAIALVFVLQIAMAPLPNLEPVTLLFVLYTLHFGRKTLLIVYAFALLEGVYYGFHLWWVMYLYVWTILYLIVRLLSREKRHGALFWAVTAGLYGLAFGFLCCFPYVALGGIEMALSWWIAGIPFDIPHGIGNFVIMLVLFHPLDRVMTLLRLGEPGSRPVPPATPITVTFIVWSFYGWSFMRPGIGRGTVTGPRGAKKTGIASLRRPSPETRARQASMLA